MAVFDWFKKSGRRGGGRSGRRKGGAARRPSPARRDPDAGTEFIQTPQQPPSPAPTPAQSPSAAPLPPQPAAPPAPPQPAPPQAAAPPAQAEAPAPGGAGATSYHSVGPKKGGLVAVLIAKDGGMRDEVFKVYDGENILGRGSTAQVRFDESDDRISREHTKIIHEGGSFGIMPLKETNPTLLNGDVISGGAVLSDGDEIQLGSTTLKFRVS